jgi:hypothetical protein
MVQAVTPNFDKNYKMSEGEVEEAEKLQVTKADKDNNTPAWQRYKAGDERYELHPDMKDDKPEPSLNDLVKQDAESEVDEADCPSCDGEGEYKDAKGKTRSCPDCEGEGDVDDDFGAEDLLDPEFDESISHMKKLAGVMTSRPKAKKAENQTTPRSIHKRKQQ